MQDASTSVINSECLDTQIKNPAPTRISITPDKKTYISLSNVDCLEYFRGVPTGSVDLVLLDPPYEISRKTGFKNCKNGVERFAVSMDFGSWDHNFPEMAMVVEEAFRTLRKGGTAIIFYDLWKISVLAQYLETAGFKQLRLIEWLKTNPVPLNSKRNYLTNSREIAISAVKGSNPTFNSSYDNGVYNAPICHEKGRFHPTQKPLGLISDLVKKHSNPGDSVLDCFSGSGTTAVAAGLLGRSFTGCELDKEYFKKSSERIRRTLCLAASSKVEVLFND
jgi:site-specific DNA-methyltransferase (adenine-specific)